MPKYSESQNIGNTLISVLVTLIGVAILINLFINPVAIGIKVLMILLFGLIFGSLLLVKLKVAVLDNALQYSFLPFVGKRVLPFDEIESIEAFRVKPLWEFGGWGLRYSFKYSCWGYIMQGNNAVLVTRKNGKRFVMTIKDIQQFSAACPLLNTHAAEV